MKREISAAFLSIFILLSVVSCGKKGEAAMSYGDSIITVNEYSYMMSTYKYVFSRSYDGFKDTDEYYDSVFSNGTTYAELLDDIACYNIKVSLISRDLFDEYGFELDEEDVKRVDDYIEKLINKAGGKTQLNEALSSYGVNYKMLREINLNDVKTEKLCNMLFDEGKMTVSDGDRENFCEESYVHFLHLYINSDNKEKADEAAYLLEDGALFEDVYADYSEDRLYDDGYYLRRNAEFFTGVIDAAFELEVGEYTLVETDDGFHFILRLKSEPSAYLDSRYADFFTDFEKSVAESVYSNMINEKINVVEINDEIANEYSIRNVKMNSVY